MSDLTTPQYWGSRQAFSSPLSEEAFQFEWIPILFPFLKPFAGGRFLELGCSPGLCSAAICSQIAFQPFGIDSSPQADEYLNTLRKSGIHNATLYPCDIRDFKSEVPFDVVASFGLIEHFLDPSEMLQIHHRLLRQGGLCVLVVPHFRKTQFWYHDLFDQPDLKKHNLRIMHLPYFKRFAQAQKQEILFLGFAGRMKFWNYDFQTGDRFRILGRRILSKCARIGGKVFSSIFPIVSSMYSPWIMYVGKKL